MRRTFGWEQRLDALFIAARKRPFGWGSHDCLLFVADDVLALTGYDPGAELRGKYDDELGAYRLMRDFVGDVPLKAALPAAAVRIADSIGAREVALGFARRGDIASITGAEHDCLAVVGPSGRELVSVSPTGLARVPIAAGHTFWAIG